MNKLNAEILVVGGGAAGLSATAAASEKARVVIVDDNPMLGGQIWRAEMGKVRSPAAQRLIHSIDNKKVRIINDAQVFASKSVDRLIAQTRTGPVEIEFGKLIIATGARERFLPFPGWTLQNVYGAGGLQAMVKGGVNVRGKKVVIAGTGPLLLVVADYLRAKGANVVAIAEQASAGKINRFAVGLWRSPRRIAQAAALRSRLLGVPYLTDCWVMSASGAGKLEQVALVHKGRSRTIASDLIACGFHLVPSIELASLLGCEIRDGCVAVDEFQATSAENVYCAGEPTGIGGVDASVVEGQIAGFAASGQIGAARKLFKSRDRTRRFADAINKSFELRDELKTLASDDTIVCRCEDVVYGRLTAYNNFRDAKLQTRCGMGACQGRVCGAATEFMFGWERGSVRPPIFPVKMEDL